LSRRVDKNPEKSYGISRQSLCSRQGDTKSLLFRQETAEIRKRELHTTSSAEQRLLWYECGWNNGKSLPLNGVLAVKIMPDFGTLRENEAAFDVAVASINSGESEWGRSILTALRDHICSTGEQKSVQWILPQVLAILEARKSCPPMPLSYVR